MSVKILTVDDSKVVRIMVGRALARFDCQLLEAANGQEGLTVAARELPHLILLDVTMPMMDGMTMLKHLREMPGISGIPVIMLTAESAQDNIARADSLGIAGYIAKPFKEQQLLDAISAVLPLTPKAA